MDAELNTSRYPSRILVRGTNWVGDTIISLPAIKELRRIFHAAHIAFWVPAGLAQLARATGIPDEIVAFDGDAGGPLIRPFRMRRKLAQGTYDLVVLFQNAFESAFTSWIARIPLRAGYPTDMRGPLLNLRIPLSGDIRRKHQVFYYLAITDYLGERFGHNISHESRSPDCSIELETSSLDRARDMLLKLGADLSRPVFCLCPGSVNSEAKRWPPENFALLADLLIDRTGAQVVFAGAQAETGLVEGIIASMRSRGAVNAAGKADMLASMAVMRLSAMVISNDTGSAHLGVAASSKVLTIFGPTSPGATAPFGPDAHIIQGHAPCAPCRHFRCPERDHPCMRTVSPEAVFEKVTEILTET